VAAIWKTLFEQVQTHFRPNADGQGEDRGPSGNHFSWQGADATRLADPVPNLEIFGARAALPTMR